MKLKKEKKMKARDVMIDIETLDTTSKAVVLSVGIVRFNPVSQDVASANLMILNIDEQLALGRIISPDTLRWWFNPERDIEQLRAQLVPVGSSPMPLHLVLERIHAICESGHRIWGNGVGFDNTILHSLAVDALGVPVWKFWKDRCFRTFARTFDPEAKLRPGQADHNALADANLQVQWMCNIIEHHGLQEHFS
jgi:hypothetical protein